uniref:Uncharacterized protein n=1 Tax=Anguilla anguilla TaxID=7936 RepID=A0A0E9PPL7_ANGAN
MCITVTAVRAYRDVGFPINITNYVIFDCVIILRLFCQSFCIELLWT